MTDRPIILSAPSVLSTFARTKTQTRRLVRWPSDFRPPEDDPRRGQIEATEYGLRMRTHGGVLGIPMRAYACQGDLLWVRETWCDGYPGSADPILYRATYHGGCDHKWRPSIFMPRWASRLSLRVTAVRVERLQSISEEDAVAEGVHRSLSIPGETARDVYRGLWDTINGKRGPWITNPFVWVVSYEIET